MLTEGEKLRAQRLLGGQGLSFNAVGRKLGIPADTLRRELKSDKPRGRHKQIVEDLKDLKIGRSAAGINHGWAEPPAEVLADRERRLAIEPQSVTAALMGDPIPRRSALDKRRIRLVSSR